LFEHWLEPVFEHAHPYLRQAGYSHGLEWGLMGLATSLAVVGFLVARWLYLDAKNPIPARLLESQQPLISTAHRVVYNKYYVDEIYDAGVVRRSVDLSRVLAWVDSNIVDGVVNLAGFIGRMFGNLQGLIDRWFVDGLVNLVGDVILWAGARLRTVQTGRIQSYVVGLLMGSILVAFVAYVAVR
jgi:NADH-quinone oxidoreductase subunit L